MKRPHMDPYGFECFPEADGITRHEGDSGLGIIPVKDD